MATFVDLPEGASVAPTTSSFSDLPEGASVVEQPSTRELVSQAIVEPAIETFASGVEQFSGYVVIVDISGYTEFVRMHRTAMVHAEQIVTDLMESVLDVQGPPLVLDKLMGDAATFYAVDSGEAAADAIAGQVVRFFEAFNQLEGV